MRFVIILVKNSMSKKSLFQNKFEDNYGEKAQL